MTDPNAHTFYSRDRYHSLLALNCLLAEVLGLYEENGFLNAAKNADIVSTTLTLSFAALFVAGDVAFCDVRCRTRDKYQTHLMAFSLGEVFLHSQLAGGDTSISLPQILPIWVGTGLTLSLVCRAALVESPQATHLSQPCSCHRTNQSPSFDLIATQYPKT